MKKMTMALFAFSFALANVQVAQGSQSTNGMPLKPCYVDGKMEHVLMDYYQCKKINGSHHRS